MSEQPNTAAQGEAGPHRELPDGKALAKAGDVMIKDKEGNSLPLKSLWAGKSENERQLIVFVRHFFCGVSIHCYRPWLAVPTLDCSLSTQLNNISTRAASNIYGR